MPPRGREELNLAGEPFRIGIALSDNPRTRPLIEGRATIDGADAAISVLHPSEMFWRQLKYAEFDVSEMSISSLLMATARGDTRFVGIPAFTTRAFYHTAILVRTDRGIEAPKDLIGKRVGVPEYQQTAALWARGALEHEFGVAPRDMEFWMERTPEVSHGGSTGFVPPPGVTVHRIPPEENIGTMLASGALDATLRYIRSGNLVDRSTLDLSKYPQVRPLFLDVYAEGKRYFAKTGMFPINHATVIRRDTAEKHPWLVRAVFDAFVAASEMSEAARLAHMAEHIAVGALPKDALSTQLVHHGIARNRSVLETIAQYSHEQGLTPRRLALGELFAPGLMDT